MAPADVFCRLEVWGLRDGVGAPAGDERGQVARPTARPAKRQRREEGEGADAATAADLPLTRPGTGVDSGADAAAGEPPVATSVIIPRVPDGSRISDAEASRLRALEDAQWRAFAERLAAEAAAEAARKAEKERLAEEAAIEAARKAEEDRLDNTQSLEAFVQRFQQRMAALRARP